MSSLEQTVSTTKLKLKEKIAYGLGDVGNNFFIRFKADIFIKVLYQIY